MLNSVNRQLERDNQDKERSNKMKEGLCWREREREAETGRDRKRRERERGGGGGHDFTLPTGS